MAATGGATGDQLVAVLEAQDFQIAIDRAWPEAVKILAAVLH
jgi:hypothetical protein